MLLLQFVCTILCTRVNYSNAVSPKDVHLLKIDTTEVEDFEYTIFYSYKENDNNPIQINSKLELESPDPISVYLYATSASADFPECYKAQLKSVYSSETDSGEYIIELSSLPPVCLPPIATITIIDKSTVFTSLSIVTKSNPDSGTSTNPIKMGQTSVFRNKKDVNVSIYARVDDLCYEPIKKFEVKLKEFVTVIINDDYIPKQCIRSDKNTLCYADSFDECAEGVEGRVFTYRYDNDPGENIDIRIFTNLTKDFTSYIYKHNVTIGPKYTVELVNAQEISGGADSYLYIDNLTFNPSDADKIKIKSPRIYIKPSTGKPIKNINLIAHVIEGDEDQTDSSKYPHIYIEGKGEVSLINYPIDNIEKNSNLKINDGVYVVCNADAKDSKCPTKEYNNYKVIKVLSSIVDELKPKRIVYTFLSTFTDNVNVDLSKLSNQTFIFVNIEDNSKSLLDSEKPRLRFLSTKQVTSGTSELYLGDDNENRLYINRYDNLDKIVVVCESFLTLKQREYTNNGDKLLIEPIFANSTIYFDKSFRSSDTKIKIDMKNVQNIKVYAESFDSDYLNRIISCGDNSCGENDIDFEHGIPPELVQPSDSDNKNDKDDDDNDKNKGGDDKKGLNGGAIAGIVIAVIVVVAAVIVGVIIFMKKKKNDKSSNEANDI